MNSNRINLSIISFIIIFLLSIILAINSKPIPKVILKKEKYSKEYINLISFVKSYNGYINQKLIPNETSNINRYIMAKDKIKKNEVLLIIPDSILISKLHKLVFPKCQNAYGFNEEYEYECIVYFMTIDKYNSSSIFKPYYDYLPKINLSDFVFSFSEKEKELFEETGITEGIFNYEHFLNKALTPVEQKLKKFTEKNNIKYEKILDEFKTNFILVGTRNFGRPDTIFDVNTMTPFLDLINHSDKNNTEWLYDESRKAYILKSGRDIEKNEEITDSYGKLSNSNLLKIYGFVIPGNIYHDNVYIKLDGERFTLNVGFLKSKVDTMFEKLTRLKKYEFKNSTNIILKSLNDKKDYYLKLKTNRFSMNIIIKEHLDIINEFIDSVRIYTFNYKFKNL